MSDLRTSIGAFFLLVGLLLLTAAQASVNLYSGLMMIAFGGTMIVLGRRASR